MHFCDLEPVCVCGYYSVCMLAGEQLSVLLCTSHNDASCFFGFTAPYQFNITICGT